MTNPWFITALTLLGIAFIVAYSFRPRPRTRRAWLRALRPELTPGQNDSFSILGLPLDGAYVRWNSCVDDVRDFLDSHEADSSRTFEVIRHLCRTWPGGIALYSAWRTLPEARDMGMLDDDFMPIDYHGSVDEEHRLRAEIVQLGGITALAAYLDATHR